MIVRRGLPLLSTILVILGLELATGALSDAVGRIGGVAEALVSGGATDVYLPAYFAGLLAIGGGLVGLAVSLWSRLSRGGIARGTACPECGAEMRRIRRKGRHRLLARLLDEEIQRRICTECGWKGLTRIR